MGGLKQAQIRAQDMPDRDDEGQESYALFAALRLLSEGDNMLRAAMENPAEYGTMRDRVMQTEIDLGADTHDYDPTDDFVEDR